MRKSILMLVPFLILISLMSSCKKVIKLDLNTASPQMVIEGNIYDQPGPCIVKIYKSVNFDQSNPIPILQLPAQELLFAIIQEIRNS